jgi:hypothetical protein
MFARETSHLLDLFTASQSRHDFAPLAHRECISSLLAFLSVLLVIVGTMPNFPTVLGEKDAKVVSLPFLMGCSEFASWLVVIFTPIVITIISYLFMSFCYCCLFLMVGTSCTSSSDVR